VLVTSDPFPSAQEPAVLAASAPAVAPVVIRIEDLRHRYGDRVALDGVSFDVHSAEIFGLLGPNGSGKTTMFRILSTLMLPSGGRAIIMGHDAATDPTGLRRAIGVVF
jgi:ABC-2 type transport system ATP-binding protein